MNKRPLWAAVAYLQAFDCGSNQPVLSTAGVDPEHNTNYAAGVKTTLFERLLFDVAVYYTQVRDSQATVVERSQPVARRGYRQHLAARQVATTAAPLSDIGYRFGFSSHSHFTARFRERFGMTPRDYRGGVALA